MSLATATYSHSATAAVLSGGQWLPSYKPEAASTVTSTQQTVMRVEVPDFDLYFTTALRSLRTEDDYSEVIAEALIDPGVMAVLNLKNQPAGEGDSLQVREVALNFEVVAPRPRAHFVAASLYAMLGLAGHVQIVLPGMNLNLGVNFSMPLSESSRLLQGRQTYFGLMVIERATGLEFEVPEQITADDLNAVSFAYHAIVEREFVWLTNDVTVYMPAAEQYLTWARDPRSTQPNPFEFGPTPTSRTVFGQMVALGEEIVRVSDGVIQDLEKARRALTHLDGRMVPIRVRPLSRVGLYSLPNAPRLPESPWDEKIAACIALENQLNVRLATRYNELAASTLAGLTPAEADAVTTRPALDEDAHLIKE